MNYNRQLQRQPNDERIPGYHDTEAGGFDANAPASWLVGLVGSESMDLVNDPRFFSTTVIEKRLAAFSGLATVGTLALGHCVSGMFSLKKDMNFDDKFDLFDFIPVYIGWLQIGSFFVEMFISFMLLTAVFVMVQQMFYVHRLLTAGPLGFEQASLFYLNRTMTAWRHLSMKSLLFGLVGYMLASGFVLFVKFLKDAMAKNEASVGLLAKALNTTATPAFKAFVHERESESVQMVMENWKAHIASIGSEDLGKIHEWTLDMNFHGLLAILVLAVFVLFSFYLIHIYRSHLICFQEHYKYAHNYQDHLTIPLRTMSATRSRDGLLET